MRAIAWRQGKRRRERGGREKRKEEEKKKGREKKQKRKNEGHIGEDSLAQVKGEKGALFT